MECSHFLSKMTTCDPVYGNLAQQENVDQKKNIYATSITNIFLLLDVSLLSRISVDWVTH